MEMASKGGGQKSREMLLDEHLLCSGHEISNKIPKAWDGYMISVSWWINKKIANRADQNQESSFPFSVDRGALIKVQGSHSSLTHNLVHKL